MSTNKKLSLIALVSLMSSVALPTGYKGGGVYQAPAASEVYSAGPSTTDSLGATQPALLDASDTYTEGDNSVSLETGPVIFEPNATATPMLGKDGGGIQKKQPARLGRDGHGIWKKDSPKARQCTLTKDYNKYSSALLEVANYRTKIAKYNMDVCKGKKFGGMQVPGYDKFKAAMTTIRNYENPVTPTSNEIID